MKIHWNKSLLIGGLIFIVAGCSSGDPALIPTLSADEGRVEVVEEGDSLPEIDPGAIYATRCAGCHAADRSGDRGPALLPQKLMKGSEAYAATITNGSGPMPAFGSRLSAEEINALVDFILSDPQ